MGVMDLTGLVDTETLGALAPWKEPIVPRTQRPYPEEFRAEAVRLVRESGKTMTQVAADLGVSVESLRHWLQRQEIEEGQRRGLTADEREGLRGLGRGLLQQEREMA